MIWAAASTSGWRIVGTKTTRAHRLTGPPGSIGRAPLMSYDLDLGRTTQITCGRPIATITIQACDIQPTACALLPRLRRDCMNVMRMAGVATLLVLLITPALPQ